MSVHTTYDEMRDKLKEELTKCLSQAQALLDPNIWGFDEMEKDYAMTLYEAVKKARDSV